MATGIKEIAKGRSDLYRVDPRDLNVKEGWNVRDDESLDLDEIMPSIRELGVKQALTVQVEDGKLFVTDGHRRYFATMKLIEQGVDIKTVPVQTEDRYSNAADHIASMIVRNSGKPLTAIEQARVFKRLLDFGLSQTEIASKVGKSRQWVVNMLELNAAPEELKTLVKSGKVTATLAHKTLSKEGGTEATKTLTKAVKKAEKEGKTKATEKHVKPSAKSELRELFDGLTFKAGADCSAGYSVQMTADQYAKFRSLAGV